MSEELGEFVEILPPQKRVGEQWYSGNGRRRLSKPLFDHAREPEAFDHAVGRPRLQDGLRAHVAFSRRATAQRCTLAAIEVPIADASRFGIPAIDSQERVIGFQEKPQVPNAIPGSADFALASMGVYIFEMDVLVQRARCRRGTSDDPRFRNRHHPGVDHRGPGVCVPFLRREQEVVQHTGGTSERSTRTSKPTWISAR